MTRWIEEGVRQTDLPCSIDGCTKPRRARGWCVNHYALFRKNGGPLIQKRRSNGEGTINWMGYYLLKLPDHPNANVNGYVGQHRVIMAEHLGRPLLKGENVHHRNGNRADNRLGNLELWVTIQPAGQRVEELLEWARTIIERYGDGQASSPLT